MLATKNSTPPCSPPHPIVWQSGNFCNLRVTFVRWPGQVQQHENGAWWLNLPKWAWNAVHEPHHWEITGSKSSREQNCSCAIGVQEGATLNTQSMVLANCELECVVMPGEAVSTDTVGWLHASWQKPALAFALVCNCCIKWENLLLGGNWHVTELGENRVYTASTHTFDGPAVPLSQVTCLN